MACRIKYNDNGTVNTVLDDNGQPNALFTKISKIPIIGTKEKALEIYKQSLGFEGGGELQFKAGDNIYNTYKEALSNGGEIQVGFYENNISTNINNANIDEHTKRILEGKSVFKRFSPKTHRGLVRGGQHHVRATLITRGGNSTNEKESQGGEKKAEEEIERYALEQGILFNASEFAKSDLTGSEAEVWFEGANVRKSIMTTIQGGMGALLDRITIHNSYFPESTIEVVGFTKTSFGLEVVITQPFIKDASKPTIFEIRDYIKQLGFEEKGGLGTEDIVYTNDEVALTDLHKNNILKTKKGNLIVIDGLFYLNTKEVGYGGDVVLENKIENFDSNSNETEFKTLLKVVPTKDPRTRVGFINKGISDGIIKDELHEHNGELYLRPEGRDFMEEQVSAVILQDSLRYHVGSINYKETEGLFKLSPEKQVTDTVADQLTKDIASAVMPKEQNNINAPTQVDEDSLKLRLLELLAKLGVDRISISDYLQRFSDRNLPISVEGLADLANNVIAVKDSTDISTLAEETMHFLVASLPTETLQRLYRNIENTQEYKTNEKRYREAYTKQGRTENETEQMVKEEVLGKIFKNALLEATQQTSTPVSFYRRAVTAITDFFNTILNNNYTEELLEVNKLVNQFVLNKEVADFSTLEKIDREDAILYSLSGASGNPNLDTFRASLSGLMNSLQKSFKSLKSDSNFKISDLRSLTVEMDSLGQAQAASAYIGMASRLTNHVVSSLDQADKENRMLSSRDRNAFENLKTEVEKDLRRLKESIDNKDIDQIGLKSKKEKDFLLAEINGQLEKISRIQPVFDSLRNRVFDNLSERLTKKYNFPPYYKEFVKKSLESNDKELGVFMRYAGQMDNTSNAYLLMAQNVIEEMDSQRRDNSFENQNKFRKVISDLGLVGKDLDALITEDGYLQSKWDFSTHKKDIDSVYLQIAIEMGIVEKGTELKEFNEKRDSGEVDIYSNPKYFLEVNQAILKKGINVRPSTDKYYEDREKQLKEAGADADIITFLKGLSYSRGSVYRKHTDRNGLVNLTPQAKNILKLITKERANAKSLYDEISELKKGIEQVSTPTNESIEVGGLNYILKEDASIPARRAFVMQKLDIGFKIERDKAVEAGTEVFETNSEKLEEHLEGLTDEEFVNFLANNVGIRFTSKFYDGEGINVSDTTDPQVIKVLELRSKLSSIYARYRDSFNPAEIMGNEMTTNDMNNLKEIHKRLSSESRVLAEKQNVEYDFGSSESQTNNAYDIYLQQKGISSYSNAEFEVIAENMTENQATKARSVWKDITEFEKTGIKSAILVKYIRENNLQGNGIRIDFIDITKTKMYPYFKRSVPVGFESFESINNITELDIESKAASMREQFKKYKEDSDLYEFTVNYDFKKNKDLTNPEYDKNFLGGAYQPSLSYGNGKYVNKQYHNLFGIQVGTDNVTKNHDLYKALQAIITSKTDAHERMDVPSMANVYLLPQVRRSKTERVASSLKMGILKTIEETLKDTVSNNIDEKEFGQQENGDGLNEIPQFFVTPLKDQSIVSRDIYSSLVQMIDQSTLYESRKNKYSDITAIQEKMFESYGSDANASKSESYKMLRNKIDSQFFGVNESVKKEISIGHLGTIDVSTTARMLQGFVRYKNLAGFIVIPITSYLTGKIALTIESLTGQYVSKDSLSLATTKAKSMLSEYVSYDNTFGFNNKSELHKLLNSFGFDDSVEKARNAKYGKTGRTMGKMSMFMHKAANLPVIPRTILANIFDTRIVNNKIVNREDFSKQFRREGVSQKEIDKKWSEYRDESLNKYLEYTDKGVVISDKIKEVLDGSQDVNNEWVKLKQRAKKMAATVDGQIPDSKKIEAQRHFLMNFFTTHMSWFAISLQNRFKGINPNSESGQLEMGTYNALFHTMREMLSEYKKGTTSVKDLYKTVRKDPKFQEKLIGDRILSKENFKSEMKDIIPKETLNMMGDGFNMDKVRNQIHSDISNLSQEEQSAIKDKYDRVVATESLKDEAVNLLTFMEKRLLMDSAMYIAIGSLYLLLQGVADDDELKRKSPIINNIFNMGAYLAQRSTSETGSTQLLGSIKNIYGVAESPFVGLAQIKNIVANIPNALSTDKVKSGVYKGDTEMYKYWFKNVIPFHGEVKKLGNLEQTRKNYKNYNGTLVDSLEKIFSGD